MALRLSPRARADLNDIWLYVAPESGGTDTVNRLVDMITSRFSILSTFPHAGRRLILISDQDAVVCRRAST